MSRFEKMPSLQSVTAEALDTLGFKRVHDKAPFLTMRKGTTYDVLIADFYVRIWCTKNGEEKVIYESPDNLTIEESLEALKAILT